MCGEADKEITAYSETGPSCVISDCHGASIAAPSRAEVLRGQVLPCLGG